MDKARFEIMIYGHCCPECYPDRVGMVRRSDNIDILSCEICGFEIDDTFLSVPCISLEEIAHNYLGLIKQMLLNTKSDYTKYSKLREFKLTNTRKKRTENELKAIVKWVEDSKLLTSLAHLANLNEYYFKKRVEKEIKTSNRYNWKVLFKKFNRFYTE